MLRQSFVASLMWPSAGFQGFTMQYSQFHRPLMVSYIPPLDHIIRLVDMKGELVKRHEESGREKELGRDRRESK